MYRTEIVRHRKVYSADCIRIKPYLYTNFTASASRRDANIHFNAYDNHSSEKHS